MSLTGTDYATLAHNAGRNIYFIAEGDRDGNIARQVVTPANPCCNCYSIAKAFTVTAIGMLCDRGLIHTEDTAVSFISDLCPDGMDEKWRRVTLDQLMLHSAGFGRGLLDIDSDDASTYPTHNYLDIVLSEPIPYEPGTHRQYTDAAYYLLSRIVERVSGRELATFLRPTLVDVMNFKEYAWSTCPHGYSMGATGLYLRTEDVVKLGILYLRGGDWFGERIISEDWVKTVLERGYEFKPRGNGWYGKGGMRGQMLTFNPSRGIAVAWHGYDGGSAYDALIRS